MSDQLIPLKVLSLNCHGLCCISCDRAQRMRSIAKFLCLSKFNIVCLQEVFVAKDYHYLSEAVRPCLPFSHWYTNSSLVGSSGLVIMSRWPLNNVHFHQFRLQGHPLMIWHGDWFAKKGVAYARIDLGPVTLNVFNMHLHANYGFCEYELQRICQAYEMSRYIETVCGTTNNNSTILLAGDMNTMHTELGYRIVQTRLSLFDCHITCPPDCHCKLDSPPNIFDLITAKIDFIFVRLPKDMISTIEVFQENGHDSQGNELSDHLPLVARITLSNNQNGANGNLPVKMNPLTKYQYSHKECLEQMLQTLNTYLKDDLGRNSMFAWVANAICFVAFVLCIFLYPMNQLETALLLMLLLWVMYTITITNIVLQDGVSKAVRYMIISVQNDLAHFNQQQATQLNENTSS